MTVQEVIASAKSNDVKMVDLKFTYSWGMAALYDSSKNELTESLFKDGLGFDGSSIRGWKGIQASDMLVLPDPTTAFIDPRCRAHTKPDMRYRRPYIPRSSMTALLGALPDGQKTTFEGQELEMLPTLAQRQSFLFLMMCATEQLPTNPSTKWTQKKAFGEVVPRTTPIKDTKSATRRATCLSLLETSRWTCATRWCSRCRTSVLKWSVKITRLLLADKLI